MKIAISSKGKSGNDLLDARFGRCEYFQICDTKDNSFKVIENKGQSSNGGAGIAAANQIIDENVDIIITGNLGPNAFELINKAEIKAYKCESISIEAALNKYNNNELEEIKIPGMSHSGMHI